MNKVLLEPLPYPDPDRLVQLMSKSPLGDQTVVSIPKYGVWRDPSVFQYMAAYDFAGPDVNLTEGEFPQPVETARVSADYFRLFGGEIVAGRTFSNRDDWPGAARVAVIGDRLWRTRFRANAALVGNTVSLDHEPCRIIGVLAAGFTGDKPIDVWLPLQADFAVAGHMNRVRVAARLRPGVTVEMAAAGMAGTQGGFLQRSERGVGGYRAPDHRRRRGRSRGRTAPRADDVRARRAIVERDDRAEQPRPADHLGVPHVRRWRFARRDRARTAGGQRASPGTSADDA